MEPERQREDGLLEKKLFSFFLSSFIEMVVVCAKRNFRKFWK